MIGVAPDEKTDRLEFLIGETIRSSGEPALSSDTIIRRLRKSRRITFNAHDVLKLLREPVFTLTDHGWAVDSQLRIWHHTPAAEALAAQPCQNQS